MVQKCLVDLELLKKYSETCDCDVLFSFFLFRNKITTISEVRIWHLPFM